MRTRAAEKTRCSGGVFCEVRCAGDFFFGGGERVERVSLPVGEDRAECFPDRAAIERRRRCAMARFLGGDG